MRYLLVSVALFHLAGVCLASEYDRDSKTDAKGGQDHPLVSRYPGSRIVSYRVQDYGQHEAALGPSRGSQSRTQVVEGKVTRIVYAAPEGRSVLEIYRNYENALKKAGFKTVFAADGRALGVNFAERLYGIASQPCLTQEDRQRKDPERYLFARLPRGKANTWVTLYVTTTRASKRLCQSPGYYELVVVEEKQMESGLVSVSAAEMARALEETGHIAIYGIYFDTDKATLKPESAPTLQEIAKLLQSKPNLKLNVVGHTDSVGAMEHNMELSRTRAEATVQELEGKHQVAAGRLAAYGVGPLAPVETNQTEAGRAKNRRVELIQR